MAVVNTAAVAYSSAGSYAPYMVYPASAVDYGGVGEFNPWPTATPPTSYLQRVWDSGSNVWCYYIKLFVDPNPASGETTPPYTGSISAHSVILESQ